MLIDDRDLTSKLGDFLESLAVSSDEKHIRGEIYIVVSVEQKEGRKGIKFFPGTNTNADFKSRVCETAMEILINDSEIRQLGEGKDESQVLV